jgi:hypothetical protein
MFFSLSTAKVQLFAHTPIGKYEKVCRTLPNVTGEFPLAGVEEGTFVRRSALWDASACQRQVWKKSKTKNYVFRFALLSLIRTFDL